MANVKLSAKTELTSVASGDLLHIVDISDTTDGANGTSKKITKANLVTGLATTDLTGVTASAAEVNILDGVTATTAELNILDGVTSTATEINVLDGIPATLTATELGYVDGVTSAIQTQLDAKAPLSAPVFTGVVNASSGILTAGVEDTTIGNLTMYGSGPGSEEGGQFQLQLAADHDTTFEEWVVDVNQDDLRFFTSDAAVTNKMTAEGQLQLPTTGSGAGVLIGGDANLYRSAANTLKTDDNFIIGGTPTSTTGSATTVDGTQTLTNKRVTKRITTIVSSATPTINTDNCDCVTITALATNITSMTTNLSGTPTNFQTLLFRILDDGTPRTISWGASFQAMGVDLPTTTTASKVLTVGFLYDTVDSKWGCVFSVEEA